MLAVARAPAQVTAIITCSRCALFPTWQPGVSEHAGPPHSFMGFL
jgi:hypothetical protein